MFQSVRQTSRDASAHWNARLRSPRSVWPAPPVEYTPSLDSRRDGGGCGWSRDEDGKAIRRVKATRGPHERRKHIERDDDDDDYVASPNPQPAKPRNPRPPLARAMRQTEFPLTLAAAKAHQASQWAIGDALIAECGSPPEFHHGPDGSYAKIEAARACLLKNGVDYAANTLRKIRNVAFRFRPPDRRPVSFCMHQESGTPETLDAIIASLQEREKLSVDYVQEFMRARSGAPRPVKRDVAPDDIAGLVARMTEVLKKQVMAIRVKTIVELMDALGIGLSDLSAPACQLIAARQSVPVDDPGQGVGAVACR